MSANNNYILNRIFTKNTFNEWATRKNKQAIELSIQKYLSSSQDWSNKKVITEIYKVMSKTYRNEYIYKNTLLNKLLLGRHSINTTTALTEVPVEKSKADFILINGRAIVYEIKTELDNLDRLKGQLNDYYTAFDHVCVITSESNYEKVLELLGDSSVGICTLTQRNTISTRKEPISYTSNLNYLSMFKILRKQECENILMTHHGTLPRVNQVRYYKECLKLFSEISLEKAYRYMLIELKKRNRVNKERFLTNVPYELKSLVYFSNYKDRDYEALEKFLDGNFRG